MTTKLILSIFFMLITVCNSSEGTLHQLQERARKLTSSNGYLNRANIDEFRGLFQDYTRHFRRKYEVNTIEYEHRFDIFLQSLERQRKLNLRERELGGSANYGLNQFSDITPEEFEESLGKEIEAPEGIGNPIRLKQENRPDDFCAFYPTPVPKYKNWVKEGKVSSVKNQGSCGSCWAFSGAEQVESYWAISGKQLKDLSVQELLSCAPSLGCNGGNTCAALGWLAETSFNGSRLQLVPASVYPYVDDDTPCDVSKLSTHGAQISAICGCAPLIGEEHIMKSVVGLKGPMAVNVNAVMWHDYTGGIIQHHCTNLTMNHAVQLVGYDMTGEVPSWLVRNSWGPEFGEKGYLRLKYGENTCGIAQGPSYVVV